MRLLGIMLAMLVMAPGSGREASRTPAPRRYHVAAPELLLGRFADDYEIIHVISDSQWALGSRDRYRIVAWNDTAGYLIAQNDPNNSADAGKWTRIDWIRLEAMPPWEWAFCMIEYAAPTREVAEANRSAGRANPKHGCSGYPFSRMRRIPPDSMF